MREAIHHLRSGDPVLARIIDTVGPYAIEFHEPSFDALVRSIVNQQLSGKAALTIYNRLTAALSGGRITPEAILKLRPARMRAAGLSAAKTAYIRDLARHVRDGRIVFQKLAELADHEVIEHLTVVKGIGVWTAHMFLIFALRRHNVLPTGDLGIRVAIRRAYGLADLPKPSEIQALAHQWHPYCSVACWYLWRSLESKAGL